ncbi:cytochrome C oxidase subunit II [Virgibacillus xinjiangensis]|uniref:Cytochrome C oxidase subunit II n=1 Tax=Virgibacillus xinjiangensis TaxID=393090 RepID=A0ABV7CWX1_9BACI
MKKGLLAFLVLALVLFLAACGGGSDEVSGPEDTDDATAAEETAEETESESAEGEASNEINLTATNFDLGGEEFVVNSGEEVTLTLTNEEGNHGVAIDELDVDLQGEGEVTFVPEEPGEYTIYCNIFCGEDHDQMTATLIVQ